MSKVLLAILSCLYLLVTSGMQVQHHYCMGHLRATTFGFHESKKCGTCGMEAGSTECCHDESQWLKVNDNHQAVSALVDVPAPFVLNLPPANHFFLLPVVQTTQAALINNNFLPPLLADTKV